MSIRKSVVAVVGATGANKNWKLAVAGTATDYIAGDNVVFDDSAAGTRSVVISSANVNPSTTTFDTVTNDYSLSGAFGIAGGSLTKNGTAPRPSTREPCSLAMARWTAPSPTPRR